MVRLIKQMFARRATTLARFGLVWWVPALLAVHLKNQIIGDDGLMIVSRYLGKIEYERKPGEGVHWEDCFAPWEHLSFYRGELLWGLVVLPGVMLFLTSGLRARYRAAALAAASLLVSGALYAELLSVRTVGRMLSLTLAADALTFGACCAPTAREYFGPVQSAQLLGLAVLTVVLACWSARGARRDAGGLTARWERRALLGLWGAGLVTTAVAWVPWLPTVPYHTSVHVDAVKTFFSDEGLDLAQFESLSLEGLARRYRELTHSPAPASPSPYRGKAAGCDVIMVVLETAPARCLDIGGDLPDCPTLDRLRRRAWVGTRHHSTYAYTTRAVFSLLSGWHPSTLMVNLPERHPTLVFPGFVQGLKASGYQTALYAPDRFTYRHDDNQFAKLGVDRRFYAELVEDPPPGESFEENRVRRDREALAVLKRDMAEWHRKDQRFVALYLPQLGHGPWFDFTGLDDASLLAKGRKLIAMQDAWLGEIVAQLERAGRLDKTILVVVGDHGIRATREDPDFRPGLIDDYSFHVPMLVWAPAALDRRQDLPWITSHVDLSPTVLELVGVRAWRDSEQGLPVWDSRLAGRNNYFLANHLFGADGYSSGGRYLMWNHLNGAVYESDTLHFGMDNLVPRNSPRYQEVVGHLKQMAALFEVWARSRCGHPGYTAGTAPAQAPPSTASLRR